MHAANIPRGLIYLSFKVILEYCLINILSMRNCSLENWKKFLCKETLCSGKLTDLNGVLKFLKNWPKILWGYLQP